MRRKVVGTWGERIAAVYLAKRGYTILATNVFIPHGEIDIICLKGSVLLFIEVKTSQSRIPPSEYVTAGKKRRLTRSVRYWLSQRDIPSDLNCGIGFVFIWLRHGTLKIVARTSDIGLFY